MKIRFNFLMKFVLLANFIFSINLIAQNDNLFYKTYYDVLNESEIILKSNNRFFAELYFVNDEGGGYSGFWWIKQDTLFLISDKIECDLVDLMKIKKAEILKFYFHIKDNFLIFSKLEIFDKNEFVNVNFNQQLEKRFIEKNVTDYWNLFEKNNKLDSAYTINLINTFWISNDNKILFRILSDLTIEYYELTSLVKRYGYLLFNSTSHQFEYEIILDNIMITNYENTLSMKNVSFDKIILNYQNGNFELKDYLSVNCFVGSESVYNSWYDFNNSDYFQVINSKIIRTNNNRIKFSKSTEKSFNNELSKYKFK